eukprot:CAMPEP_0179445400 /NCGR_PEP_ID=MMETSP0799-20121207/28835_1 /TAXON_ID=46947 /ORGANISM="Geminigera cryophila, Strain CCMP2564" /LENGTH=186 /DNA_ID=CAMNT_0021233383 /DNA_START=66 /DNA_END=627 /DNA_ORIENTATION=+
MAAPQFQQHPHAMPGNLSDFVDWRLHASQALNTPGSATLYPGAAGLRGHSLLQLALQPARASRLTLAKSASHGSSSRSRATSSVNTMCPLDESDMTRDAMLLAEAMLLLQKSVHRDESSPTAQLLHPNISASSSGCSSEISGASTRHCEHCEDSVDSSPSGLRGGGASACSSSWTAQPLSVASLLN